MPDRADVAGLPTFAALEALPVLAGVRPAASVQFDRTYLAGQAAMLEQVPDEWASERAVARGRRVVEVLRETVGELVAADYLRLNYSSD